MRRLTVAAAVVALGALASAGSAQACRCAQTPPAEAMQRADAAISGQLVKVIPQGSLRAVYRYRVQRVYKKGDGLERGAVISVRSARDSAACGLPTQTGRRYGLLLSWREGDGWTSGACTLLRKPSCAS